MKESIDLTLSTSVKRDSALKIDLTIRSRDIHNSAFMLTFVDGQNKPLELDDTFTVEVLSVFTKEQVQSVTTATIYANYAHWEFDTSLISGDDTVFNYVYIKKDGVPIVSADANAFYFNVGLSKIDENAGRIAESYDENYEKILHEFEVAINLTKDEWAQMADEARNFVDEIKDVTVDEFVELKMGEELANLEANYATRLTGLESADQTITAQLAQTMKLNSKVQTVPNLYENATAPISTNNLIHAVVEYVDESFGGHKYWMATTPYTDSNELIENPTIHYSDDGVNWNQPVGVNPLAPNPADTGENNNWHNSDTFLLYRKDLKRMEVWWRRRYRASGDPSSPEVILRRTSLNGTNWTQEEELFRFNNSPSGDQALSPSAIYNYSTNKYECWLMKANANNVAITDLIRFYVADGSGKNWVLQNEFEPAFENELEKSNWRIWHGSVSKTGAYYELVVSAGNINNNNGMWAFYATSINGREWSKLSPLLKPKNNSTDSTNIYHISLTKTNDEHILYYTGINDQGRWTLNRSVINRFSMADFQMVNEKNTANLKTLISQQLNNEITYYTKLGENFTYQKGWTWVDGIHMINHPTRIALHQMPLPTNGKFEISGFGNGWNFAYFLSDKNFIMHYDSGWKTGKHSFTTDDQESYLFITVRKNIDEPLVTGAFESENTHAQLRITVSNETLISRIEQVESSVNNDEINQSLGNIKLYLGWSPLIISDVESGNWTYTGSTAVGEDIIKGESANRIRIKTPINLMPNKAYNLRGMDDNWRAGFFLLDANNKILLDSGNLNSIKPGWQNDGYTFTTTSNTNSIVFTISKVSLAPFVTNEYLSLTSQITITSS